MARTLGVSGADIVQVVVLERLGGRAVDDFTVVWPGAARVERLLAGLAAIPGVRVDGVWRAIGAPTTTGQDAELLAQVAGEPGRRGGHPGRRGARAARRRLGGGRRRAGGLGSRGGGARRRRPSAHASWRAPDPPRLPEVTPLRARAMTTARTATHYAIAPFGRAGLVLVVARDHSRDRWPPPGSTPPRWTGSPSWSAPAR